MSCCLAEDLATRWHFERVVRTVVLELRLTVAAFVEGRVRLTADVAVYRERCISEPLCL